MTPGRSSSPPEPSSLPDLFYDLTKTLSSILTLLGTLHPLLGTKHPFLFLILLLHQVWLTNAQALKRFAMVLKLLGCQEPFDSLTGGVEPYRCACFRRVKDLHKSIHRLSHGLLGITFMTMWWSSEWDTNHIAPTYWRVISRNVICWLKMGIRLHVGVRHTGQVWLYSIGNKMYTGVFATQRWEIAFLTAKSEWRMRHKQ